MPGPNYYDQGPETAPDERSAGKHRVWKLLLDDGTITTFAREERVSEVVLLGILPKSFIGYRVKGYRNIYQSEWREYPITPKQWLAKYLANLN